MYLQILYIINQQNIPNYFRYSILLVGRSVGRCVCVSTVYNIIMIFSRAFSAGNHRSNSAMFYVHRLDLSLYILACQSLYNTILLYYIPNITCSWISVGRRHGSNNRWRIDELHWLLTLSMACLKPIPIIYYMVVILGIIIHIYNRVPF